MIIGNKIMFEHNSKFLVTSHVLFKKETIDIYSIYYDPL